MTWKAGRHAEAGFTMVELTVALLAGLIVAMGIVALSREATTSFHEEARISAAEAALRTVMDRLRSDLSRAGYMCTGNIQADTNIATKPGQSNVALVQNAPAVIGLQSVLLQSGGSLANGLALSATNGLSPDLIQIAGNLTTADQYDVASIGQAGQGNGNCLPIDLSPSTPAMYRLLGDAGGLAELQNAFQPDPNAQFIVRLVDDSGRSQYLVTCSTTAVGVDSATGFPAVWIDTSKTTLMTAQNTGTMGALSGYAAGRAWLNPVQIVRWEITQPGSGPALGHTEPAQFVSVFQPGNTPLDPTKYDLMRTVLDINFNATAVQEVVAEYAVDLKFAFAVDTSPVPVSPNPPAPSLQIYPFDTAGSSSNGTVAAQVTSANLATARPQRIRSVSVRLSTRTAQPDRTVTIAVTPNQADTFIYRYQVLPGAAANIESWARARTLTAEVALTNQAGNFY